MNIDFYRTLDANINRICEGLRVIEDVLRFNADKNCLIKEFKQIRHLIREKFSDKFKKELLQARDAENDPGKELSAIELNRQSLYNLLKANFLRIQEGLRVIEEILKLKGDENQNLENIKLIKTARFNIYQLEKEVLLSMM